MIKISDSEYQLVDFTGEMKVKCGRWGKAKTKAKGWLIFITPEDIIYESEKHKFLPTPFLKEMYQLFKGWK